MVGSIKVVPAVQLMKAGSENRPCLCAPDTPNPRSIPLRRQPYFFIDPSSCFFILEHKRHLAELDSLQGVAETAKDLVEQLLQENEQLVDQVLQRVDKTAEGSAERVDETEDRA